MFSSLKLPNNVIGQALDKFWGICRSVAMAQANAGKKEA
jgi:hypothetical protein